jgi:hypothetical protein
MEVSHGSFNHVTSHDSQSHDHFFLQQKHIFFQKNQVTPHHTINSTSGTPLEYREMSYENGCYAALCFDLRYNTK